MFFTGDTERSTVGATMSVLYSSINCPTEKLISTKCNNYFCMTNSNNTITSN